MTEPGQEPWTDDSTTAEEQKVLNALRDRGFVVVIWTPTEVGDADGDTLEEIVIERGNNFLESVNGSDAEDEGNA